MRRLLVLLLLAVPAFGRTLHWDAIDVEARLDRHGVLHVRERQEMVFDGDWNGGERSFATGRRQSVHVERIVRIDGDREIPLTRGELDRVDRWNDTGNNVIRWRSRLPSDPPFANRKLIYRIDYSYRNVLVPRDDPRKFALDHDFGFADRAGIIERYTLRVDFDPLWNARPLTLTRNNLVPGEGVHVDQELSWSGEGEPAGIERPIARWIPFAALAFFALGAAFLYWRFIVAEREVGRLEPVQARFHDEVLRLPAEVAGAVWDLSIGAPEVAAVLARMTQEKKLSSRVDDGVLHLNLKVSRRELAGYESALVKKLFFSGGDSTNTDDIKEHYSSTGMDPAELIRSGVNEKLGRISSHWDRKEKRFSGGMDALLLVLALGLLAASAFMSEQDVVAAVLGFFIGGFLSIFACVAAVYYSKSVTSIETAVIVPTMIYLVACLPFAIAALWARYTGLHAPVLFALALWMLALLKLILDLLKIRDAREKIAYRKRVAGTRAFFLEQLRQPNPQLRDEWYPYILAFGLGTHVDRWFRSHGGAAESTGMPSTWSSSSSSTSSSSSSSSSSWTGGGGAFGGAGASGAWAVAAGTMASGVASPSSSGGSGGGGGGSSSSGGGGGGGW